MPTCQCGQGRDHGAILLIEILKPPVHRHLQQLSQYLSSFGDIWKQLVQLGLGLLPISVRHCPGWDLRYMQVIHCMYWWLECILDSGRQHNGHSVYTLLPHYPHALPALRCYHGVGYSLRMHHQSTCRLLSGALPLKVGCCWVHSRPSSNALRHIGCVGPQVLASCSSCSPAQWAQQAVCCVRAVAHQLCARARGFQGICVYAGRKEALFGETVTQFSDWCVPDSVVPLHKSTALQRKNNKRTRPY